MRFHLRFTSCMPVLAVFLAAGCRDAIGPAAPPAPAPHALGLMEVTISGIGSSQMQASASLPSLSGGPRYNLSAPTGTSGTGNGSLQLAPLSTGSFTEGVRGSGGVRYVYATFRIRNAQADSTSYDTPRQNLTFFAVETANTLRQSAVARMRRFDGSAAQDSIALGVLPTGAVYRSPNGSVASSGADVLQVITEAEAGAVSTSGTSVTSVLPYGFVARNAGDDSRTLPASPAAGVYDGVVTFAFKIPLQASAAEDPFTLSVMVLAEDDSETRITQSLEEQNAAGRAAFEARASAIGASTVTLLGGGSYSGSAPARTICSVRVAGPVGAPTATLTSSAPCTASGMSIQWTGAASSDWSDNGNWNPQIVPTANDTAVIRTTATQPIIGDGNKSILSLVMTDAGTTLALSGYTLSVGGAVSASGGTVTGGTVLLTGNPASLAGAMPTLGVSGGVALQGSTSASGAVSVTGSLSTNGQALTISLP